jgi:hypothetical protein
MIVERVGPAYAARNVYLILKKHNNVTRAPSSSTCHAWEQNWKNDQNWENDHKDGMAVLGLEDSFTNEANKIG